MSLIFFATRSLVGLAASSLVLALPLVSCCPTSVVAGDEEVDEGEKVLGKLVLSSTSLLATVNHEPHAMALEDGLE